jgi:HEPN domain-containing protein
MRDETKSWLAKANKDLGTAIFAMDSVDGPLPLTTGLHCQKSAEEFLKAYLQEMSAGFSEQQSLGSLFDACIFADHDFELLRAEISRLEGYAIASRYPKESLEFRKNAIATATRVKEFVINKLG